MYHLVEFDDRYVVVTREDECELPNIAVAFASGAVAAFSCEGSALKELHLIFYKRFFSRADVVDFLKSYRFQKTALKNILGVKGAEAYADLGNEHALVLTTLRSEGSTNGGNIKTMPVRRPNDPKWLEYERPIITGLFEIIYQTVASKYKSFPEVRLGMPPAEKVVDRKENCEFQIMQTLLVEKREKRITYTLTYACANIEGIYTPVEIWNGIWKGFALIFRLSERKNTVAIGDDKLFQELTNRGFEPAEFASICKTFGTKKVYHALVEVS